MIEKYDFSGYATKNDLRCSDGRTIRKDAFIENDGQTVPLVWSHDHNSPDNVLGHALLKNVEDGVYAYGKFNDTPAGRQGKALVEHGDIKHLSIYANKLKQNGGDVVHGLIREVSLVLSGANPGAVIDYPIMAHSGEEVYDEAIIYLSDDETISLYHADEDKKENNTEEEKKEVADEKNTNTDETLEDIFNTLSDKQKDAVYAMIGMILEDEEIAQGDDDGEYFYDEGEDMKHNVFDQDEVAGNFLSHEDMETIFRDAKRLGSLREAVAEHQENGVLAHSIDTTDMIGPSSATASQTYGFRDPDMIFPDARALNNTPEWIKRETGWVADVMNGVHRTPFSRIKSVFADITEDAARAKGYLKGHLKKEEVFTLLKRSTTPTTIYKKQKLDRDDVIDITDFDVVAWIRGEMRVMLDEEIARAILIGDGRSTSSDDKISETNVRPIATDAPLFSVPVNVPAGTNDSETAKNFIDAAIRGRKNYKGSGTPTLYTTADWHTEMLLLEDQIGHKLYKSDAELATALRVSKIVEVEVMEGQKVNNRDLVGIIVNMNDYNVGADKGGEINMFDDFDIDYNQMKYLMETRISGALTKPFSALILTKGSAASE